VNADWLELILVAIIGIMLGIGCTSMLYQHDAIQHNAAHYDSQTGQWEWNK
jgi:hypothetical protein